MKVKLTLWIDRRLRKALKVVCSYRNISITQATKYMLAYYVFCDGVIPKYDTKKAAEKIIKYAKVAEYETNDIEEDLNEKESQYVADQEETD